jgi:hypothetical protein
MSPLRDSTLTTWDLFKEIQLASSHVRADALASEIEDGCAIPFPPWSVPRATPHRWISRPHLLEAPHV